MSTYVFFWATSLLSGLLIRRRLTTNFFLLFIFLFVGLRFETGFDWPVYKRIHETFMDSFSLAEVVVVSAFSGQEVGFIFALGLFSYYLQSFEAFQALVTILLLWSTVFLARAVNVQKVAMVIAIALAYLMWSVGFSTLRQSMAISFFNFGLAYSIKRKRIPGIAFFTASILFQVSSMIYIAAFLASRYIWSTSRPPKLRTFLISAIGAAALLPFALQAASMASSIAAEKIAYYLQSGMAIRFGLFEIIFIAFFLAVAVLASIRMSSPANETSGVNDLRRLIMFLSAIGISSTFFPVMRDRVSYEVFLLISIYLMAPGVRHRWHFTAFFTLFGLLNSVISIFPYPNRLAFEPYQNVVLSNVLGQESTGSERNEIFMEIHIERMEAPR